VSVADIWPVAFHIQEILIAADHNTNSTGLKAAERLS
jgi:hypothetical protein